MVTVAQLRVILQWVPGDWLLAGPEGRWLDFWESYDGQQLYRGGLDKNGVVFADPNVAGTEAAVFRPEQE